MGKKKPQKKNSQSNAQTTTKSKPEPSSSPVDEKPPSAEEVDEPPPLVNEQELPPPEPEPQNAEKIKEDGNVQFKAGNYSRAIDLYAKAIALQPKEPNYWNNRAAAYMAQKKFSLALDDAQTAATLQASSPQPKTLLRLARCHLALGNVAGALNTLKQCLDVESSNAAALKMIKDAKRLEGHLQTYHDAKSKKDWAMARLALDRCFSEAENGGSDEWKRWRIEMEIMKGRWDSAQTLTNEAIQSSPQSPDLQHIRGVIHFLMSRIPSAIQCCQTALRFDPEHIAARQLLRRVREVERLKEEGNNLFKGSRFRDAAEKYGECLDAIGEREEEGRGGQLRGTLLSNRAVAYYKLDNFKESLQDAEACLVLQPDSFKAIRTQARCQLALEDYESAVRSYNAALQVNAVSISREEEHTLKTELRKAETLLKRSKTKDYYKILGLNRNCSEAEIKKAYRKESLIHHPDKGGDEEKFKLVVEAHAVLSDPARRDRYDNGEDEDGQMDGGMGGMGGMGGVNLADLLRQMHMGGGGFSFSSGGPGGNPFGGGGHSHSSYGF